jgi:hypothetical protein
VVDPLHDQGTHHWLLTLDGLGSRSGTCTPLPGESRYGLYLRIRATVLDTEHLADELTPVTMFFDVQPNMLPTRGKIVKNFVTKQFVCLHWLYPLRKRTGRPKRRHDWQITEGTEAPVYTCRRCTYRIGF